MKSDEELGCAGLIVLALIIGALALLNALWWQPMRCSSRWPDDVTRWTWMAGCQVNVNGRWVPEDRIRDLPSK